MSDSMVRRWIRQFNEGFDPVHNEERSGRPSLVTDKLQLLTQLKRRLREP